MRLRHAKTLITGKPGVGKTTLIQKIIERMRSVNMAGFCTAGIRCLGSRLGFELQGLNGERRTLAHVEIDSRNRVGRYGVDTNKGVKSSRTAPCCNEGNVGLCSRICRGRNRVYERNG